MKIITTLTLSIISSIAIAQHHTETAFEFAVKQTDLLLDEVNQAKAQKPDLASPRTLDTLGNLVLVPSKDWVSGFFPGELWSLYEHTHDQKWLTAAKTFTTHIEKEQFNGGTHDMGFKVFSSAGNAYRLTHDEHYKDVLLTAAKTLSTRFNPVTGCIKSWDNSKWQFPVIIDNMLNLELLFTATKLTGDSIYHNIAVSHANITMKNHFRPDFSSFHVVDYDPATGQVISRKTHQGYSDQSAWARGQAWGLYGFTMCYRFTGKKAYLNQAENIAQFVFNNPALPADKVPYWDFNAPGIPKEPRDASAAAVMASALYELSTYSSKGIMYRKLADEIMRNLTRFYRAQPGESRGFLLLHSTGHKPANTEIDVPISYADYYYLEALTRKHRLYSRGR